MLHLLVDLLAHMAYTQHGAWEVEFPLYVCERIYAPGDFLSVCDTAGKVGELGVLVGCAVGDVGVSVLAVYLECGGEVNWAVEAENELVDSVAQFWAEVEEAEWLDLIR